MPIELKMDTDPTAIAGEESSLVTLQTDVSSWQTSASNIRTSASNAWEGAAANSFDASAEKIGTALSDVKKKLDDYKSAVTTLHDELVKVKGKLDGIKTEAPGKGLVVSGTQVQEPKAPVFAQSPDSPPVTAENNPEQAKYEQQVRDYNAFVTTHDDARSIEAQAHNAFQRSCQDISAPEGWDSVWAALGIPTTTGAAFFFAVEKSNDAANVAGSVIIQRFGRFAYRENGKYAKLPPSLRAAAAAVDDPKNWQNLANASNNSRSWLGFGKGLKGFASKAAPVINVLAAGITGWKAVSEQWGRDSYDPTLSTGEKVTRSAANAAWDIAPGLAGSAGGAAGGAALGTLICPGVGTAIGGVIGGLAGGGVGNWLHDKFDTAVDSLIDKIRW